MLETARELTLEAAQSAAINRTSSTDYTSRTYSPAHIKKLLDSRHERDVLDGMRRVISLMYRSEPSLTFFSAVVKNVASANLEVKKLVYIYLVHHAEAEPDLALLSINAIQKSLTDSSPQVRTMALRTMSGIRVPVISQIVSLAIKRGCGDMSPHVRKAAALAIPKCYRLDPNTLPQLMGYLEILLGDSQYFVVGPAVAAFLDLCPDEIDLIHKNYRSLVKKLVDMDEWGQLATLRLLTFYARKCFPRRTQKVKRTAPEAFYDDEKQQQETQNDAEEYEVPVMDPDLELLLRACKILLQSRNSAVIVSVVRCFLYLAPSEYIATAVGPLVALLRSPQDMQLIALYNIVAVALRAPKPFAKYTAHFLVHANDPPHIWRLKLEVLTILFPHCGKHWKGVIISELEHFSKGADPELVRESVRAIGRCAQGDPSTAGMCLRILLGQISSADGNLVSEALTVIRHLIQQDPASHKNTVLQLVKHLGSTTHPDARATIIWLVGEFAGIDPENNIAPDVLRVLIKGFADEMEIVKQQIVLLGAKVYLHHLLQNPPKEQVEQLSSPPSFPEAEAPAKSQQEFHNEWNDNGDDEPKDAELNEGEGTAAKNIKKITNLLETPSSTQLANLLLLAPKPVPHAPSPSETRKDLLIGSATLVVGSDAGHHGLPGYENLPDWVEPGQEPNPSLRTEDVKPDTSSNTASMTAGDRLDKALREHKTTVPSRDRNGPAMPTDPTGKKTLDQWLQEEEEEETETESETDSEEGETDSEEEETDSEEGSSSEEDDSEEETDSESEAVSKEAQTLLH
ncbi:Armadillo-like helical [Penicillium coprophilum]|uniref:Armadillo-like helical n=1 Tax=Penicillium coprophilum TaxID=36646 RepID=UPI0023931577|nr:Armadillo-like helical [Penicillium coprophilum]KAJ5177964.1 Armadillo-like helical [Penicillium coprophilum]